MKQLRRIVGAVCVLSFLAPAPSAYANSYFENFESGSLTGWQNANTGGISSFGV